ncbi:MAG: hypothetical protein IKA37_06235 [Spirochaetales bacterium]|nr:hypothetical protein [Spirochaetales bacterium]
MIRKFINFLGIATSVAILASCSGATENLEDNQVETTATNEVVYYENASLSLAKLVAETYLIEHETINDWENTTLGEPYPLYNPATDVITYLEYPVIKDGKRKGYIMVTLKEDEPRVVEASENSEMTNYEALANKAGTADIKAIRFSFASFVAEDPTISRSGSRKVLAALGNIEHEIEIGEVSRSGSSYEEIVNNYKERVEKNGGFLDINKDVYEANKEWIDYRNGQRSRGKALEDADKSPITKELSKYSGSYHTLVANQFTTGNDTLSGCVPTAGAIALAYYARKHNKPKLWRNCGTPDKCFIGDSATSEVDVRNFKSIVNELRKYLGMGENENSSITSWLPGKLSHYSYMNGCGWIPYQEVYGGESWTGYGFKRLLDYLNTNNPCFLGYYEHSKDVVKKGGHAAVIYKAKVQRDWADNYKECTYYITTGWKDPATKSVNTWDWCIYDISMQSYSYIK